MNGNRPRQQQRQASRPEPAPAPPPAHRSRALIAVYYGRYGYFALPVVHIGSPVEPSTDWIGVVLTLGGRLVAAGDPRLVSQHGELIGLAKIAGADAPCILRQEQLPKHWQQVARRAAQRKEADHGK